MDYSGASFLQFDNTLDVPFVIGSLDNRPIVKYWLVCYTAVFSVVTQRSSPLVGGEKRCVTTLKTAV